MIDTGNRVVRLINAASGTFAQFVVPEEVVSNDRFVCRGVLTRHIFQIWQGAAAVGSPGAALFKVIPGSNLGEYA
jgi:hypothetical protein